MKLKEIIIKTGLLLTAIIITLILLEISLRTHRFFKTKNTLPLHIPLDSPVLYGLNPKHPAINSHGLRDDEITIPKPKKSLRILVLGDSIAYGICVKKEIIFPQLLENMLPKPGSVEVINAAVPGYTAYNELQYYLTKGWQFEADIVLVAFCMNDVANPRLHWVQTKKEIINIPKEAIPNIDYDQKNILPLIKKRKIESMLYKTIKWKINYLFPPKNKHNPDIKSKFPTYITGEDSLSIKVLLEPTSPESRWLTAIYSKLNQAVKNHGATLVITFFPLAYQLDQNYPFYPQKLLTEYCQQNNIQHLDLLPAFKKHRQEDLFLLQNGEWYDIWHLTEYGHEISAQEIAKYLKENNLL